ncbi:phosphonate C-P lyase system protein PhnH [Oceanobacillus sp. 143]|uniref:Phosphonate C-P lyase system protein PhnH n=1 Tax=Oceanobacillus zhaokaii TaxID=2052660 RepID=A0A345PLJ5_9BACI|nr:phosphonate C-P lyase system protein PhnH [Oceanobacillus zhaokaii]AXI10875.1 phosphonate C-P lyase system protein PhnH [Oceanobacillus zhaokaii]QGS69739.1 phosphonate C-P lyase system protein PhnH [Oceanobacillus sp. 143]
MAIDQVHDTQHVYRKLLHSMSRPGTISSIHEIAERIVYKLPCYQATFLSVMTLLDAEVTFHILSEKNQELIEKISEYTLAKYAPITEADFVIVLHDDTESTIIQAMEYCKIGNLIDPQASATWIIECPLIANEAELTLTGPGIKHHTELQVGLTQEIWQARNERTKEYPLGIDLIFIDEKAQLACVPRTTSVEILEVK